MKISKECIDEAIRALKDFSGEELKEYVRDVFERAKKFKGMSNNRAFDEAMKEINNERMKSYFESAMTAANNSVKIQKNANLIREGKADLKTTSIKRSMNQSNNIAAAQKAAHQELDGAFFDNVTREEVAFLSSGDNDRLIAYAFDERKVESKEAKQIAKVWKEVYFPERNTNLITSNAMPFEHINQDRSFRNIHDPNKIIMGGRSAINVAKSKEKFDASAAKKKWVETVKKHFDLVHSDAVDIDGKVDVAKLDKIIGEMYDNITTGKSDLLTRSVVVNDRVAIQNRSRRRLQPKSMLDFVEYNQEYGQGNLYGALLSDMQGAANKIGLARIMGDSPHAAYLDLKKVQQEVSPKDALWYRNADLYFEEVLGTNKVAVSQTLAKFDANSRALSAMARLPLVALRSLPDINYMATFAMNHGFNYFEAWGTHLKYLFDLYPSAERRHLAKLYSGMFRQQLGYMGRFGDANNLSDRLNKISTAFFKWNGLHGLDNSQKMSGLYIVSKGLGRNSRKAFDALPLATKNWVGRFLEPREWDLLRSKSERGMFTVDNVKKLTEKELKEFYDNGAKDRPLHELRNDLYRKVHAMGQIATENMVLNPGEFERAFMLRGTKPGTPEGVTLRQTFHFKGYSLSYIDKVLIQGYKTADAAQQKLAWATATMIGAMPLAYGLMFFENLAMGKSMPDVTKMNAWRRWQPLVKECYQGECNL